MLSYQKGEEPGMLHTNSCEVLRATSVGHEFSGSPALTGHGQNGFWRPEKTLRQINAGVGSEKLGRYAPKWSRPGVKFEVPTDSSTPMTVSDSE